MEVPFRADPNAFKVAFGHKTGGDRTSEFLQTESVQHGVFVGTVKYMKVETVTIERPRRDRWKCVWKTRLAVVMVRK